MKDINRYTMGEWGPGTANAKRFEEMSNAEAKEAFHVFLNMRAWRMEVFSSFFDFPSNVLENGEFEIIDRILVPLFTSGKLYYTKEENGRFPNSLNGFGYQIAWDMGIIAGEYLMKCYPSYAWGLLKTKRLNHAGRNWPQVGYGPKCETPISIVERMIGRGSLIANGMRVEEGWNGAVQVAKKSIETWGMKG